MKQNYKVSAMVLVLMSTIVTSILSWRKAPEYRHIPEYTITVRNAFLAIPVHVSWESTADARTFEYGEEAAKPETGSKNIKRLKETKITYKGFLKKLTITTGDGRTKTYTDTPKKEPWMDEDQHTLTFSQIGWRYIWGGNLNRYEKFTIVDKGWGKPGIEFSKSKLK